MVMRPGRDGIEVLPHRDAICRRPPGDADEFLPTGRGPRRSLVGEGKGFVIVNRDEDPAVALGQLQFGQRLRIVEMARPDHDPARGIGAPDHGEDVDQQRVPTIR